MLRPLIQRPRQNAAHRSRERGITMALVALAIFSIIAMAGLSIDVGTLYQASAEAQRAADAAALAGARAISMSGITGATTPTTDNASWKQICGGTGSIATDIAAAVAEQNFIGGSAPPAPTVTYSASTDSVSSGKQDCSSLTAAFGVNPVVTVKVTQSSLPTYFARIWGRTGNSVSATASAEVFNPSDSATNPSGKGMVPVRPRCVKPWMVPNYDPLHLPLCSGTGCAHFVDPTTGSIVTAGIFPASGGVIGEMFWLVPDCNASGTSCTLLLNGVTPEQPQANTGLSTHTPNLEYVPGQASFASVAVPVDGSNACSAVASSSNNYAPAIAGCDQSTQYQCGVDGTNVVNLSENPIATGDTTNGAMCLTHQQTTAVGSGPTGQDALSPVTPPPTYPFQIQAGTKNTLTAAQGHLITSSTSIVSLPIYELPPGTPLINPTGTTAVTIVGFLQVFIYQVDANGNVNVVVMNVSGCGDKALASDAYVTGTSPVPVRLITPQ